MYLKAVEINGFKSFGEKAYIEFNKGITAIVGPNGSGKSNILDAVLWVLGEQSYKNIRAKESQDVIFSGGKDKKPAGKAEVSLIFENSDRYLDFDNDIIKITRKIQITGENEYLINDIKSKLKDISSLFLDTGIGKTAYSVIGQGKVERIINSSPKEIKSIIEEAAGIKKLQFNKIETQKNLMNLEINLDKVEFILNETRENKNKIEKQAENAQNFLNIKNESLSLAKGIYLTELNIKQKLFSETNINLENKKNELQNEKDNLASTEKILYDIENEKIKIKSSKETIDEKNKELKDLIAKLEQDKAVIKTEIKGLEKLKSKEEENKLKLDISLSKIETEKIEIETEKINITNTLKDMEESILGFKKELSKLEKIEAEKIELNDIRNNKIRDLELDKQKANQDIENNQRNLKNYENEIINSENELRDLNQKLSEVEKEKIEKSESFNKILEKQNENNERRDFLTNQLSEIGRNINKISTTNRELEYQEKNSSGKLEALKRLDENNEGFFKGVKEVLDNNLPGVHGVLLSIINFEQKFEKAIEASASGNLQDIVVENKDVAKKAISILNEKKVGRVSFLALDIIKPNKKVFNANIKNVYGVAADLIKVDSKFDKNFQKVIDFVFGNILIVENIDVATDILAKNIFSGNIVTLAGELLSSRGRITGGENQKSTINLIFERKKEIRELQEKVSDLRNKIKENNLTKDNLIEKLEKYEDEIGTIDDLIDNLDIKRDTLKTELNDIELEFRNIKKDIHRAEFNITEASKYKTEYFNKISSFNESISSFQTHINNLINERDEEVNLLKSILKEKNELNNSFSEKNIIYQTNEDKLKQIDTTEFKLKNQEIDIGENLKNSTELILEYSDNISFLEKEESNLETQINEKNIKYLSENRELEILIEKENNLNSQEKENNKRKTELLSKVMYVENDYKKLQEFLQKITDEIDSLNFKLTDLTEIQEEKIEVDKLKLKKDYLRTIENKLNSYGSVNIDAIEEFKILKGKYEFLSEERDDIMKSKKQILDLIQEIDERIHNDFYLAYEQISENFYKICEDTIRNTEGKLNIINAHDFDNCGIEIFIKFKNKKKQPLSLLSGGEKSMVAIAFIMAIFMYKPSPFTFLDEIEAALDEKNTKNLLNKLREFTDKSQFILITHNKETMKESDSIFGVTMNKEIGISKIISPDRISRIMSEN